MIDQQAQTHLFSLYAPNLIDGSWVVAKQVTLRDQDLIHRMVKVLRFEVSQSLVIFDQQQHAIIVIKKISKKEIEVAIKRLDQNNSAQPTVTFLLPLLKKEALEEAVYSLCELGVTTIQLVIVQKSRQQLIAVKELQRLQNILIAAAEQSKNYVMAQILGPKNLSDIIAQIPQNSFCIVFDPSGESFFSLRHSFQAPAVKDQTITLLVGPEGGLTEQELELAVRNNFKRCALTSTILRAVQAVVLGAGLIRLK